MDSHQKKIYFMYIAIVLLALVIFVLWLSNIGSVFQETKQSNDDANTSNWEEFKADINKTTKDVGLYFNKEVKEGESEKIDNIASSTLVDNLILAAQELASSTADSAAATNTPIIRNDNCPEWINCMPMIDQEPTPCRIPVGCEGITQLVY